MFVGLILIGIGSLIIISQLFGISAFQLLRTWWPLLFFTYGLCRAIRHRRISPFSWALIIGGGVLLALKLHLITGTWIWIVLGICLVASGLTLLLRPRARHKHDAETFVFHGDVSSPAEDGEIERDYLDDRFFFTNDVRHYRSQSFSGGDVEVYFSNVTIDLSDVFPLENELHMRCEVYFGKLTLRVPPNWHVILDGHHYYSRNEMEKNAQPSTILLIDSDTFTGTLDIH